MQSLAVFVILVVFRRQAVTGEVLRIPPSATLGVGRRTTPPLFGLRLLEEIPAAVILAREGTLGGRAHRLPDGRIGRFGRKATDATLADFTHGAFPTEMGIDIPQELSEADLALTVDFMRGLALPERRQDRRGLALFSRVGCAGCHAPVLAIRRAALRRSPGLAGARIQS